MSAPATAPAIETGSLRITGLSKRFGKVTVLDDAALDLLPGQIHALIGQNGSGKSTVVKLLSGFHRPEPGATLEVGGQAYRFPLAAADLDRLGIAFVHQDLGLVDHASVVDNIRVGRFARGRFGGLDLEKDRAVARATLDRLGSSIDVDAPVASLSAADRALVAIARAVQALRGGQGVIVFDESTQSLPPEVLVGFYATVRDLAAQGTSILLVSHHLSEVIALADVVTVLRDGRVVASAVPTAGTSVRELTALMLGAEQAAHPVRDEVPAGGRQLLMRARGLRGRRLRGGDLEVRAGEVLGITGPTDAGHEELPYLLAGASSGAGVLEWDGDVIDLGGATSRSMIDRGVALVPQGRTTAGLALALSASDNLSLPRVASKNRWFRLARRWPAEEASEVIDAFGITPPRADLPIAAYSGGNQQKFLIGKWMVARPRVLVLHEPTQAVDVGARRDILRQLRLAAQAGTAVVVSSIDEEDLAAVCDRVLVFADGRVHAELEGPLTPDDILTALGTTPAHLQSLQSESKETR